MRILAAGIALTAAATFGALTVLAEPGEGVVQIAVRHDEPITPIPHASAAAPDRVALGRVLFEDVRLSRAKDRSCFSCHDLRSNGASVETKDKRADGLPLRRNTSTVFNAALSHRLNWLGNAAGLEEQAEAALLDRDLMNVSWPLIIKRLQADPSLSRVFRRVYGRGADRSNVLDALVTFERSLVTPGSRFDLWLLGDEQSLSVEELEGYQLFKSIGCSSCHQGVNVGANLFSRVGIFTFPRPSSTALMRVPSLRNVATTPPYFSDGRAATLETAVQIMGRLQLGRELTKAQVEAVTAFLGTLTGRYDGRPVTSSNR